MSKQSQRRQLSKEQLLNTLIQQGKRKGFLHADTIQKQFARFRLSEAAKENCTDFEREGLRLSSPIRLKIYLAMISMTTKMLKTGKPTKNFPPI